LTAVEPLDLELEAGVVLGFLGPNGAGKTTLIRMVTTILGPTGGSFQVAGIPDSRPEEIRRRVGVLPESAGYPDRQTGEEFLRYHARLYGQSRPSARASARRLLEEVRLDERSNSLVSAYSRGMRQRLGIARALVNDPQVVFLDEPTLGLDPAGQEELLAHLARAAVEDGTCIVLCSHLLDEVERVCDRVAIMNQARIVADGSVDDVIATSGVAASCRIRIDVSDIVAADEALRASPAVGALRFDNTRPGDIEIELAGDGGARADIVRLLLDVGIEPRSFDLQGARLSDAFRALTAAPQECAS